MSEVATRFERARLVGVLLFLAAAGLLVGLSLGTAQSFGPGVLYGFDFWLFVALGGVQVHCLCGLVEGRWCRVVCEPLKACCWTIPLFAILFLPIALGLENIYVWAHEPIVHAHKDLLHKSWYLNEPFYLVRSAIYLLTWSLLSIGVALTRTGSKAHGRLFALSLVYIPTSMIFASLDWGLSLEPKFVSSMYAFIWIAMQGLAGISIAALAVRATYVDTSRIDAEPPVRIVHDLGNLLLTLVIFNLYVSFLQYLIVWSGDMLAEIPWYLRRTNSGWAWFLLIAFLFQFALPFTLLLSRRVKRSLAAVGAIAAMLLVGEALHLYWLLFPAFYPEQFQISWTAVSAFFAVGGLWLAAFFTSLLRQGAGGRAT